MNPMKKSSTFPLKSHPTKLRQSVRQVLLLLALITLYPMSVQAQTPTSIDHPDVTILEQRETPDGVNTTLRIDVRKDAFLSSRQPDSNFGSDGALRLGWSGSVYEAMRILIEFDIGAIPDNAVINRTELFIYQEGVTPGGDRPMDYRAQFMRSSWDEGQVTWNNANYLGGDSLPLGSVDPGIGWKSADVTSLVKTWYSGGRSNHGLIVTGDETPANNRMSEFSSRERGSNAPYIVIDYTTVCDNQAPAATVEVLPTYSPSYFLVSWNGTDTAPSGCDPSGIASFDVEYRINGSSWQQWKNQTQSTSNHFKDWAEMATSSNSVPAPPTTPAISKALATHKPVRASMPNRPPSSLILCPPLPSRHSLP